AERIEHMLEQAVLLIAVAAAWPVCELVVQRGGIERHVEPEIRRKILERDVLCVTDVQFAQHIEARFARPGVADTFEISVETHGSTPIHFRMRSESVFARSRSHCRMRLILHRTALLRNWKLAHYRSSSKLEVKRYMAKIDEAEQNKALSVGQVAERSGVAVSTLHFYESKGMIESMRTISNQRRYKREVLRRVAIIKVAQRIGIPLAEIREALSALPEG